MCRFEFEFELPMPFAQEYFEECDVIPFCKKCKVQLPTDSAYEDGDDYYCEKCAKQRIAKFKELAAKFAETKCRITSRLPVYNPALEFKPTPQEYESGDRIAYSKNSYARHCRHHCTNYDALLSEFGGKDSNYFRDKIHRAAIRARTEELLEKAKDDDYFESDDDDELESQ